MQNAGPLSSSCSRESWMRRARAADHHIETWRASDSKNSFKSEQKPWGNVRTSDGFYGNLQENVASPSLTAWPAAYDSFDQGFGVKAAESDGGERETETARLLNLRNVDVRPQEFGFQAPETLCGQVQSASAGCLHSGYGLKMEEISTAAPPLRRPNLICFSANAKDVVKDSAAVVSGDEISQSFPGRADKCEESAAAERKRTSSALEDGEQGGLSKKSRTFKVQVRKEKLGERITALQQLVSPFGKTDTASVLLEAIGYIKFLQDQVQVLSTPYIKGFPSSQTQEDSAVSKLRGRGLCLVPISSTQLMANDNGADYWASGIGGGTRF